MMYEMRGSRSGFERASAHSSSMVLKVKKKERMPERLEPGIAGGWRESYLRGISRGLRDRGRCGP